MRTRCCIAFTTLLTMSTFAGAQSQAPAAADVGAGQKPAAKTQAGAFTIDQKGVKRGAVAASGAKGSADDPSARQHKEVNKSRDDARMGAAPAQKPKEAASPQVTGIFKN